MVQINTTYVVATVKLVQNQNDCGAEKIIIA